MVKWNDATANVIWAEFVSLDEAMRERLNALAEAVINAAASDDISEAE